MEEEDMASLNNLKYFIGTLTDSEEMGKKTFVQRKTVIIRKVLENYKNVIKIIRGKFLFFPQVEIALTTRCTLRCKDCSNLMQYYEKPKDCSFEINMTSVSNFLDAVDYVDRFILLGGEPFLYKELPIILEKILASDKVRRVWIYSNGTLLPHDMKLLELMCNEKVQLYISNYGQLSTKLNEIKILCNEKGIALKIADENSEWISAGDISKRGRSRKELELQFKNCGLSCYNMLNGRLCYCARSSSAVELGIVKNEICVDLLKQDGLNNRLYTFLHKNHQYLETCDYCDLGTDNCIKIEKAIQVTRDGSRK